MLDDDAWRWAEPQLASMGERAAIEVAPLAQIADRNTPRLVTHDARGNRIDRIDYHPSYREMARVAYGSGMIAMKYTPHDHIRDAPFVSFALGYLFAMAEMGLYCPLCMTDGVARTVTRYGTSEQIERVVPRLASHDVGTLWTGGMFLTERAGGSDVGANETYVRLDDAVASCAVIGRAIHEARWYIERRRAFGKAVIEHPLAEETLLDLEAEHLGALLMTFEAVDALRRADAGDDEAGRLLRVLTPIVKPVTGKLAVPCVSEALELVGGNGCIAAR